MRYLITFSYDGSSFYGYQKQVFKRTVQEEIEKCLTKINSNQKVNIASSGRTDAKVHALNAKAHFTIDKKLDTKLAKTSLNKLLPDDIYIKKIEEVDPKFHARFDVVKKEYKYIINMGEYEVTKRNYEFQYNKKLDVDKMNEAIKYFIGEHDFKAFTKVDKEKKTYVRNIIEAKIEEKNDKLIITFLGNGFLRYMVRNMVGTLIGVGENKISVNDINKILESKNRKNAYITANPEGLYLSNVYYK